MPGRTLALLLSDVPGDDLATIARELARFHADLVRSIRAHAEPWAAPVVLLSGGETSVTVRGEGSGGRNQEFALALGCALEEDNLNDYRAILVTPG